MSHKSPIHNSKTLEVPAREKKVIKNVCKGFIEPPLFLMQCNLSFL